MKNLFYLYVRSNLIWYLLIFAGIGYAGISFHFVSLDPFSIPRESIAPVFATGVILLATAGMVDTAIRHWSIVKISHVVEEASRGNLEVRVQNSTHATSLENLPVSINRLLDRLDAFIRESSASMDAISKSKYYRRIQSGGFEGTFVHAGENINEASSIIASRVNEQQFILDNLSDTFKQVDQMVLKGVHVLSDYSDSLYHSSSTMEKSSETILDGFNRGLDRINEIASSTEELAGAADLIHQYMERSQSIIQQAKNQASQLNLALSGLQTTASAIQEMVAVIHDISERTKMLALNASIESARAGEHGQGFSVVADEVNKLSGKSSEAIKQIEERARDVSRAVESSVQSIHGVSNVVDEIVRNFGEINHAVNEQNKATKEIASVTEGFSGESTMIKENVDSLHIHIEQIKESVKELDSFSRYMKEEGQSISERINAANHHLQRFTEIV